jgi:regulator of PEP synthase PpsR (kinase-PPPase family)
MDQTKSVPTIFIVSGGVGASGEQLVHTLLAQFPADAVRVTTVGNVRRPEQIAEALSQAEKSRALVVYTLVDPSLHDYLLDEAQRRQIQTVDLMGPIMEWVTEKLGVAPAAQPGRYRQLHSEYFERVSAIDFTMTHDDGKNPESLFSLDPQRVFGITVEPDQLLEYRTRRQKLLGAPGPSEYADAEAVYEEVEGALKVFRRGRFRIVDMTDKTIEQGADEIIRYMA